MRRRAEYLVEKRDGRLQWLRATKLARSIQGALVVGDDRECWRALDLASAVLAGLRVRMGPEPMEPLSTEVIAAAVEEVLLATGFTAAAGAYGAVAVERGRRRRTLDRLATATRPMGPLGTALPPDRL